MTKDKIYANSSIAVRFMLDKFFELNVCIPKGENRFEYADEMHALAEGIPVEYLSDFGWTDAEYNHVLRIKPSEPIYEWQYAYPDFHNSTEISKYYTDDEVIKNAQYSDQWVKLEWTMKERK